jgi:hypothetical protein
MEDRCMSEKNINHAKEEFGRWRRLGRKQLPDELREMAVRLKKEYGEKRICKELGVSSGSLWNWGRLDRESKTRGARSKGRRLKSAKRAKQNAIRFVELAPTVGRSASLSGISIEWQRADGSRMRIEGGLGIEDLTRLSSKFLELSGGVL